MEHILGNYEQFILNVDYQLGALAINRSEIAMIDHICYRVETNERYDELCQELGSLTLPVGEAMVSGRKISVFEFERPLRVGGWDVPYLEVPQPKQGSPYLEGLEHAELVVIGGLERFAKRHADVPFDTKAMKKAMNPELIVKTATVNMKFHELPLGGVVRAEQRLGLA